MCKDALNPNIAFKSRKNVPKGYFGDGDCGMV